jgi:hypothetical protein
MMPLECGAAMVESTVFLGVFAAVLAGVFFGVFVGVFVFAGVFFSSFFPFYGAAFSFLASFGASFVADFDLFYSGAALFFPANLTSASLGFFSFFLPVASSLGAAAAAFAAS